MMGLRLRTPQTSDKNPRTPGLDGIPSSHVVAFRVPETRRAPVFKTPRGTLADSEQQFAEIESYLGS